MQICRLMSTYLCRFINILLSFYPYAMAENIYVSKQVVTYEIQFKW